MNPQKNLAAESIPGITIKVQELSKRFNQEWIFRDLNYEFTSGNIYAITGPNGSGKSTLLSVLWGQVPQTKGTLQYETLSSNIIPVEEIYQHISIAAPYMDLIDEFTLLEQLQFHFRMRKIRNDLSLSDLLQKMYLEHAKDKYLSNFSSGMKQRVKLSLAFYTQANIIFLDEPGTNLDKQAFDWYYQHLLEIPKECIVFVASNNAEEYPDTSICLNIHNYKRKVNSH